MALGLDWTGQFNHSKTELLVNSTSGPESQGSESQSSRDKGHRWENRAAHCLCRVPGHSRGG